MPAGRPSSLTQETRRVILEALKAGVYVQTACQIAGVTEKTFYNWLRRGQSDDLENIEFQRFLQSAEAAIAESEASAVKSIRAAGKKNWRALAWWLSRRHRKRWGSDHQEGGAPVPAIQRNVTIKTTKRGES